MFSFNKNNNVENNKPHPSEKNNKLSSNLPYNIYCIKSRKYIKKASQNDNYLEKILELSVNELNFNNTEIKSCITNVVDIICFYKFNLYYIPNNLFFISF